MAIETGKFNRGRAEDDLVNVVVIGAGVTGLTTAVLLSRNPRYRVLVAAKHMPGDYDIEYASPWAGANYWPVSVEGSRAAKWDAETWPELARLVEQEPAAGIHFQESKVFVRAKDATSTIGAWQNTLHQPRPWFANVVPGHRVLKDSELTPSTYSSTNGVESTMKTATQNNTKFDTEEPPTAAGETYDRGTAFTSVCINTAIYLPWLVGQARAQGVIFHRAAFQHIAEAVKLISHPSQTTPGPSAHSSSPVPSRAGPKPKTVVVNCTGLGAKTLGGVGDVAMMPVRGQIALVRNSAAGLMVTSSGTDDGDDELCYVMERAAGGGTVLGGCYQKHSTDATPDPDLAQRIMQRAVALCPQLTNGRGIEALDVIRHGVGLRPVREGGTRVEREVIPISSQLDHSQTNSQDHNDDQVNSQDHQNDDQTNSQEGHNDQVNSQNNSDASTSLQVVHSYGHGGFGYQCSWGCAREVVDLVADAVRELGN